MRILSPTRPNWTILQQILRKEAKIHSKSTQDGFVFFKENALIRNTTTTKDPHSFYIKNNEPTIFHNSSYYKNEAFHELLQYKSNTFLFKSVTESKI